MNMKSGRIFWAIFLLTIGILGLVYNLTSFSMEWRFLWKFWPVLLILLGLAVVLKDQKYKWLLVGSVSCISAVLVFSIFHRGCNDVQNIFDERGPAVYQNFQEDMRENIHFASLSIDAGAGSFQITDTTSSLVAAETKSNVGNYELHRISTDSIENLTLSMGDGHVSWRGGKLRNNANVRLNPVPVWDIDLEIGAASVNLNLTPFLIRSLQISAGAASVQVRLGDRVDSSAITIEGGAASISVLIPKSVDCELTIDAPLSGKELGGFTKSRSGQYKSDGYGSSKKKMFLSIDAGVSRIEVKRY